MNADVGYQTSCIFIFTGFKEWGSPFSWRCINDSSSSKRGSREKQEENYHEAVDKEPEE